MPIWDTNAEDAPRRERMAVSNTFVSMRRTVCQIAKLLLLDSGERGR
jgi:hypothetical protein